MILLVLITYHKIKSFIALFAEYNAINNNRDVYILIEQM